MRAIASSRGKNLSSIKRWHRPSNEKSRELAWTIWQSIAHLTHRIFFLKPVRVGRCRGLLYSQVETFSLSHSGFFLGPAVEALHTVHHADTVYERPVSRR